MKNKKGDAKLKLPENLSAVVVSVYEVLQTETVRKY